MSRPPKVGETVGEAREAFLTARRYGWREAMSIGRGSAAWRSIMVSHRPHRAIGLLQQFCERIAALKDGWQEQRRGLTTNKNISDIFQRLRHAGT